MILNNVEVKGNRVTLTREELMLQLEVCIDVQKDAKTKYDFATWLIAAGHIEAIKDILSHFEA